MTAQGVSVNGDHRPGQRRSDHWLADWATALLRLLGLKPKPAGKPGHRKGGDAL